MLCLMYETKAKLLKVFHCNKTTCTHNKCTSSMWRGTKRGRERKEDRGSSCTILPAALQQKSTQYTRATTQPPALHRTDPCTVQTERRHEDESRNTRCGGLPPSNRRLHREKSEKCASKTLHLSQSQDIYQDLLVSSVLVQCSNTWLKQWIMFVVKSING